MVAEEEETERAEEMEVVATEEAMEEVVPAGVKEEVVTERTQK